MVTIDIGSLVMAAIMIIGAFVTAIKFAFDAKSSADQAKEAAANLKNEFNEKVSILSNNVAKLETKHDNLDSNIVKELGDIKIALGRIQGRLGIDGQS